VDKEQKFHSTRFRDGARVRPSDRTKARAALLTKGLGSIGNSPACPDFAGKVPVSKFIWCWCPEPEGQAGVAFRCNRGAQKDPRRLRARLLFGSCFRTLTGAAVPALQDSRLLSMPPIHAGGSLGLLGNEQSMTCWAPFFSPVSSEIPTPYHIATIH
jgi:hypothetical protein